MNCYNEEVILDNFKDKTTYANDYKKYCVFDKFDSKLDRSAKPLSEKFQIKKRIYEDHETYAKLKDDFYIRFDLLHRPKPIIQTDPRHPLPGLIAVPKEDKLEAIKKRPRIYMTPACSIDDVPDPKMREMLCQYMYTTEWRKAEIEGASGFKRRVPHITDIKSSDKITLQTDLYKPLQERFVKIGKEWDDEQPRGSSDPTREFWIHKDPQVLCSSCVNPFTMPGMGRN
ncbi:uncharacterized protein LOC115878861 isoform X2 [Sitophilus oryzae]|uniref:Uncharacterized protein LOC115878861 isoform X2 n=1 Tax=Sitophilus oryzae TaxID=7048 RepID=A0A6J2XJR9_SITOR|nr:uncharacterized protein LOC115878861 isoform X2 [Sitophilus oryzae]